MAWLHPDLLSRAPATLDTVLFDVDGVLIDTSRSYRLAVIHATDRLVRDYHGLSDAPHPLLTPDDVAAFKLAGGFNNDWDATQMLTALWTARLREWRGSPLADVTLGEWAARAGEAARARRGGLTWMRATFPASAIPPADVARWAEDEFYWGAELIREHYGHIPQYAPEAAGFVRNEAVLLPAGLVQGLAVAGISHLGLITGRVGPEVGWAVRRLVAASGLDAAAPSPFGWFGGPPVASPFGVIVSGERFTKPDPQALAYAVRAVGAAGGVYVGDTADDLDLVLRYRAELQLGDATLPPFLAAVVASGPEADVYAARGADIVIPHVRDLTDALAAIGELTAVTPRRPPPSPRRA
jgi:phosphoglycolate phosphatase-like HAD superfamily hydrolase